MIRVALPTHLRALARVDGEVQVEVAGRATQRAVLDALEAAYPVLRGTIRDQVTCQRRVRRLVREIPLAGEEPEERPPLVRDLVADRPPQHRIGGLERVEDRALGGPARHLEADLAVHARQGTQVGRQRDADHASVWTSTDSTAGRSLTIGAQVSPLSAEP
jgi:hypothetical protein